MNENDQEFGVCTDDYGTRWIIGHYSQALAPSDQCVRLGPIMRVNLACWDLPEAKALKKASADDYNQVYANCNTCVHLKRLKNDPSGYTDGVCTKDNKIMRFDRLEAMFKECHQDRSLVANAP